MIVVVPAYKPDEKLLTMIDEIIAKTDYKIVVVNDGSGEECEKIFAALPGVVTLLRHEENRGKGRAIKTALEYVQAHFPPEEGVVFADADGQHLLRDIIRVSDELMAHPGALVIGSRAFEGKVPLRSRLGNNITLGIFHLASGAKIHDTQTGLRAFCVSEAGRYIPLEGDRYEFEMNMLLQAAAQGVEMREVMIETVYLDDNKSSHFNVVKDSWKIYKIIFKFMGSNVFKFIGSSFFSFLVDYGMMFIFRFLLRGIEDGMSLTLSTVFARVISSFINYMLNKKLVFAHEGGHLKSFLRYYVLAAVILGLNVGLIHFMYETLHIALPVAKVLVETVLFIMSYSVQKLLVFKNNKKAM